VGVICHFALIRSSKHVVINAGPNMKVSLKKQDSQVPQQARRREGFLLSYVLKPGNDVELILADKDHIVKEVHQ
jgi:hypothetical protein